MSKYFSLRDYDVEAIAGVLRLLAFIVDEHLELPQDTAEFELYDDDEVVKKAVDVVKHFGLTVKALDNLKEILRE